MEPVWLRFFVGTHGEVGCDHSTTENPSLLHHGVFVIDSKYRKAVRDAEMEDVILEKWKQESRCSLSIIAVAYFFFGNSFV
jgi:hypothetical protein